jgi:hypothetical protein
MYQFSIEEYDADGKGGLLLSGGYEFSPHWQVGIYFTVGKTEAGPIEFEHKTFSILVNGVAF